MLKLFLKFIAGKLDGKKTYIGAILKGITGIIAGVSGLVGYMYPDVMPEMEPEAAIALIMGGVYAISSAFQGIGQRAANKKIEKRIDGKV